MKADSIRILVVDDNAATRYSTARVLRSVGWTVLEAATGAEAIAKVRDNVTLVILDVNLPDVMGFEVCRQIRTVEKLTRLPVIHLSATFVKDVDKVHGLEAGADGYLVHPVEPPVLIATVRAFLRARQAEDDRDQLLVSERAARAEAERANRLKDEFLATLSHELRTPLHAIIGWTQLLKMGRLSREETAEGISAIERNAHAQAQLISDLLDVSRITSGKLRLDVQPVELAAVVEAAVDAILPAATAKGIRVLKQLEPAPEPVQGDPSRLQQVVWNLVNNAVKFTPEHGQIRVMLRRIDAEMEISVVDTGQGISPELLPRIFDRFLQADGSTTRQHGGLGLGLAIAKQLVELHGGTIRAESEGPGTGATLIVTIPLTPAEQPATEREVVDQPATTIDESSNDAVRFDAARILVVDDNTDSRKMLSRVLTDCGAVTTEAASLIEALELIESFQPQVLVSDIGMPGGDGFELIRKLREGLGAAQLPAIAVTGFAGPEDRRRALQAGYQLHVSKPVDPLELTKAIASLIEQIE